MFGTRVFIVIAALLITVNARPDGYGVKGGRIHKPAANAVANAQATAHANAGGFGVAMSSASATAYSSGGDGGGETSNADASANVWVDGGNIGKAITSEKENENANEPGDSDDLRQSSDRGREKEYKCINHEAGTAGSRHRNPNAEHVQSDDDDDDDDDGDDYEDLEITGQTQDNSECGPKGFNDHGDTSGKGNKNRCKENGSSVSHKFPTQHVGFDLSGHLQHSIGTNDFNGGNVQKPVTIGGSHVTSPCAPGDSKCITHRPGVSNLHPADEPERLDSSTGSSKPIGIDDGYGGNNKKPGSMVVQNLDGSHPASPCAPRDSKCFAHKPSVSNPNPTYNQNPDLSAGSSSLAGVDGGYGGSSQTPGIIGGNHPAGVCAPGDSKCFAHKPSISNPHPMYNQNPDLSAGSSSPAVVDGGYGGTGQKFETISGSHSASPCAPGDKCSEHKPSLSADSEHKPSLSADSQHSIGVDGIHEENGQKPETIGGNHAETACSPGDSKCFARKPSVSNPYPTYNQNPHLSAGSSSPTENGDGYRGNSQKPGTIGGSHPANPCVLGDSKCLEQKPNAFDRHPTHEKHPNLSADSQHSVEIDTEYETNGKKPGANGESHTGTPCAFGDSKCFARKPSVSNPYPTYETKPDTWGSGSKYPTHFDGGYGGKPMNGDHHSSPKAVGHSASSGNKPETSNPFLSGEIDLSGIMSSNSGGLSDSKPNPLNPFLNPQIQVPSTTGHHHPSHANGNNGGYISTAPQYPEGVSSGSSQFPQIKPNPTNPFLSHHEQGTSTTGVKHPGVSSGSQQNKFPNGMSHPVTNVSPHSGCYGSVSCSPNKPSGQLPIPSKYPHGVSYPVSGNQEIKPNPFLSQHGHGDNPELDSNDKQQPHVGDHPGRQDIKPNHSNPFFSQHGHEDKPFGTKYPELGSHSNQHPHTIEDHPSYISPGKDCHESGSCSSNKPSEVTANKTPASMPGSIQSPDKHPDDSNPFLTNGQLAKPYHKPESHGPASLTPNNVQSATNPRVEHGNVPNNQVNSKNIHDSQSGISSANCNDDKGVGDNDDQISMTGKHDIDTTIVSDNYGVKGHQPGVKGGSHHQGHPTGLQHNSGHGGTGNFGSDYRSSAESSASASASAYSNAHASSSAFSSSGRSNASAKSQASSSNHGDYGTSHSWSSSSASASAFASSNSHQEWTAPVIPQVPAQ